MFKTQRRSTLGRNIGHWSVLTPDLFPGDLSCRVSTGSAHFWTFCISNLRVDSQQPPLQRKNNRLNERLIFQLWVFTWCWQINRLFHLPWTVRLCSVCRVTRIHYATPWWQRKLRGKNEPRDESKVWLEFCDSNMSKSLVLTGCLVTQWKRPVASHVDGALTHFPEMFCL